MMRRLTARTMGDFPTVASVARFVIVSLAALHVAQCLSPVRYSPRTGLAYRSQPVRRKPPPPSPLLQSRRLEAIDSWMHNIKSNYPNTNSISPSWNGKSPYKVIGVGGLPLQNEEDSVPLVSARRGPEIDFSPSSKAKYGQSRPNMPYPPQRPSRPQSRPQSSFRHKSLRPMRPQPKRLPPKSGRRPPPMYKDERALRGRPPPPPQKYPSTKYPSTQRIPTSRRGPLYPPGPASAVGRKLPGQQPLFREDFQQKNRYNRGRPGNPKDSLSTIDLAKRMPPKKTEVPAKSSENSRMEPDDFPKFPSAISPSLPSIAPTTAAKPFSSTFDPKSFSPPTFEPPKDFGRPSGDSSVRYGSTTGDDAKDFGFGPPGGLEGLGLEEFNGFESQSGGKFNGFENPFRNEEADDFPLQSFEGPPRVKPKFGNSPTHPPKGRYPGEDSHVNLGIPPPPNSHRAKRPPPPPRPKRYPPSFKPKPSSFRPKYPSKPTFKSSYKPKNDFLSPDGVFDEDTEAEFKLFGDDGSPIKSGPPVDFESAEQPGKGRRPHGRPPPQRPHHPPPPPPRQKMRPPPPPSRPRFTTQRPIPTPGPEDFPSPPPRRPTPPPTHPTHPPRITHPPEHYNGFTTVNPVDAFFDSDGKDVKLGSGNPFHGSSEVDSFINLGSSRPQSRPRQRPQQHFPSEDSRSSFRPPQNPFSGGGGPRPSAQGGHFEDEGPGFQVPESLKGIKSRPGSSFEDPFEGFNDDGRNGARPDYRSGSRPDFRSPTQSRPDFRSSGGRPDSRPDFRRPALAERGFDRGSVSDVGVGHENSGDDGGEEGFFEIPSGFPSLMSLGSGFESMKISRRRRSAQEPLVAQEGRFTPRRRRRMRNNNHHHQQQQQQLHYGYAEQDRGGGNGGYGQQRADRGHPRRQQSQSEFGIQDGFWDEVETDFFSQTGPAFGQRQQPYRNRNRGAEYSSGDYSERAEGYGYRQRQPNRAQQQTHYSGEEQNYKRVAVATDDRDNEILGSGNFDVIKGGTFYDPGTYYNLRYNTRPKQNGYGGEGFLDNFRDFADIKNDHIRRRSRY